MTLKVRSHRIGQIGLALAVVLGVGHATSQPTAAATLYSIVDLGNLGSSNGLTVTDINNLGQVVGYSAGGSFRTAPNSPINPATDDLAALGVGGWAQAINDLGQVVGIGNVGPFRTAPNSPINPATDRLGSFGVGNNIARDINNLGQVVVRVDGMRSGLRSFRTAPNSPVNQRTDDLGSFGGVISGIGLNVVYTDAFGINDLGQVVGTSLTTSLETHAFRTAPNSPINPATDDLGTLGGSRFVSGFLFGVGRVGSSAFDINNLGQVVGSSTTASGETHAFRTAPNSAINPATDDLGTLSGSTSSARAINNLGQVVGTSTTASGEERAFLYDNDQMLDLNDLIPADLGVILNYAAGINDQGQIAAGSLGPVVPGSFPRQNRIFLLTPIVSTPIPEPSSALGTLAFGVLGVGSVVRRKRISRSSN